MTIKMDPAVCLISPKSLVCNHGPTEDVFLVGGCLGCREQKPGKLARVKAEFKLARVKAEFICTGVRGASWKPHGRKSSQAFGGRKSVLWYFSAGLSASWFHSALLFFPLTSLCPPLATGFEASASEFLEQ